MCGVSPSVGQRLLGRYRVESVRDLGTGVEVGAALDEAGASLSFLAVAVPGATSRDLKQLLADQDRYRIGAQGIARPVDVGLEQDLLVLIYERR